MTDLRGLISTAPAMFLPTYGRLGRKNWRPRTPADTRFRSVRATSATNSDAPIRGEPLRSAVERLHRLHPGGAAECASSPAVRAPHPPTLAAARRSGP